MPFEILPHTADLKIRAIGRDQKELFENALAGMFFAAKPEPTDQPVEQAIEIESDNLENLLVDFLSEALTLSDIHDEVYDRVVWKVCDETKIKATLIGRRVLSFGLQIKAVTYHDLRIERDDSGLAASIVFDI